MNPRIVAPMVCMLLAASVVAEEPPALETRVFDVSTILSSRLDSRVESLGFGWPRWGEEEDADMIRFLEIEELGALFETFIEPDVWLREGVETDWEGEHRLLVTAPPAPLDEIAALLDDLFREAVRRIEVRAELVTLDAAAAKRLEESGARRALLDGRLDATTRAVILAAADRAGSSRLEGAVSLRPGRLGRIAMTSSVSYVRDLDVEIAQGSEVGDPIVDFLTTGWLLHVRPMLLTDGRVWLEVLHQAAVLDGPIRRVDPEAEPLGTIDLPAIATERLAAAGCVTPGETLALVRRGSGSPALVALLLTPRVVGEPSRGVAAGFVPTTILTRPFLSARVGWYAEDGGEWSEFPLLGQTGFLSAPRMTHTTRGAAVVDPESIASEPAGLVVKGAQGLFVKSPEALGRTRARVAAWERRVARSYCVRLGIASGDGADTRTVADLGLEVAAGRSAFWQVGTERAYIADWDVEVAQEARIGDPIIGRAFGGLLLNLRLDPAPGGDRVVGRLSLALVDLDREFEVHRAGNEKTGIVEIPRARQILLDRDLVLDPGKALTIEGGRGADGRRLVLTMEVTER